MSLPFQRRIQEVRGGAFLVSKNAGASWDEQGLSPGPGLRPCNADCERTFSMVRKIHTEARKSLNADTITAFLRCKINYNCPCYDFTVTPAILRGAKTCTQEYNVEHPTRET